MKKILSLGILLFGFILTGMSQTTPVSLDASVSVKKVIDVAANRAIRIGIDPVSGELHYATLKGFVYKVNVPIGQSATDSLFYSFSDHGLFEITGMCFHDSTLFLLGNTTPDSSYTTAKIVKGKLQSNNSRSWSVVAESEAFETAERFDHLMSSLIINLSGDTLLMSSGSRGDHGEIQDNVGLFPGKRLLPISCKVLKIPANANNLVIPNDSIALDTLGFVFAEGLRNNFDMAYHSTGELFGAENSGDRDMDDELNWLRQGLHYGFPWYMGNKKNPSQFLSYNPNTDLLFNHASSAWNNGLVTVDSTFPPIPTGINFMEPIENEGPHAAIYRDSTSGSLIDASSLNQSIYTFTAHRSPLGLTFDVDSILYGKYRGAGFVCSYTRGDSTKQGFSRIMADMGDFSEDLMYLELRKNANGDNYIVKSTKVIEKLNKPVDAVFDENVMYILETGFVPGPAIWEVTFPKYNVGISEQTNALPLTVYPNPTNGKLTISAEGLSWEDASIKIYNALGQLAMEAKVNKTNSTEHTIDVGSLSTGVYQLEVFTNEIRYSAKIIIE